MKRFWVYSLCSLGLATAFPATAARDFSWSRKGRTVLVETKDQGRDLYVFYTRRAGERDVLPELESCVKLGRKAYTAVSCAVFENTKTLSLIDSQGYRLCYLYVVNRWPNGRFTVYDNPALQLAKLCGGTVTIPP